MVWTPSPEALAAAGSVRTRHVPSPMYCDVGHRSQLDIGTGTRALKNFIVATWPGIVTTHLSGRSRPMDCTKRLDVHNAGRAIDLMKPQGEAGHALLSEIASWLVINADALGVQEILFDKKGFFSGRWVNWTPGAWGGSDHSDHIHFSLTPDGANGRLPWYSDRGVVATVDRGSQMPVEEGLSDVYAENGDFYEEEPSVLGLSLAAGVLTSVGLILYFWQKGR